MRGKMNFSEFKKCEIKPGVKRKGSYISLYRSTKRIGFSKDLVELFELKAGDRLDLYRKDNIWAFKKCDVGCVTVTKHGKGDGLGIGTQTAYLEIGPFVKANRLPAWLEDEVLYCMEEQNETTGDEE